jgi:hypothetical protein
MRTIRFLLAAFLFIPLGAAIGLAQGAANSGAIDRHVLVTRYNVVVRDMDPMGAMAVGNGELALNFDVSGL